MIKRTLSDGRTLTIHSNKGGSEALRFPRAPHKATAYVFSDVTGGEMAFPKKAWAGACKRAGILNLHFHDLRHEAGSQLMERDWPLHHVRQMLGHADVKTTSTYLNITRQGLHESMKRFGMPTWPDVAQNTGTEPLPPVQQADGSR